MPRLHLFFPENDIALVQGRVNFTPPAAARDLHAAGAVLPLWYGDAGDSVLAYGVNAEWLDTVRYQFGIGADVFDHVWRPGLVAAPWGWSAASRQVFLDEGFDRACLPTDAELDGMREVSHRRTSALLSAKLHEAMPDVFAVPAVEACSVDEIAAFLSREPAAVLKAPYSSSGRGLLFTRYAEAQVLFAQVSGIIRRQGSVMVEPERDKVADFALLFDCVDEGVSYVGLSVFGTTARGQYTGNVLAGDAELASMLGISRLDDVIEAVRDALVPLCAGCYSGPLGVDMMKCRGGSIAVAEINFRMTMGRVAHILAERYIAPDVTGRYDVVAGDVNPEKSVVRDGRLCCGSFMLNPPCSKFTFLMSAGA